MRRQPEPSAGCAAGSRSRDRLRHLTLKGEAVAKLLIAEELHVTLAVPQGLSNREVRAVYRSLLRPGFTQCVHKAVVAVLRRRPAMDPVRITIGR